MCPAASTIALSICDPLRDDCGDGYKCSPRWFEQDGEALPLDYACVSVVANAKAVGEPCTIDGAPGSPCDDCDASSRCWPGRDGFVCTAICEGDRVDTQCPDGTACAWLWDANFLMCTPTCDPLASDCGEGFGCVPTSSDAFVCFPALVGDTAALDEPCIATGERPCADGLVCVDAAMVGPRCAGEDGCCRPSCDLAAPRCADDEACIAYLDERAPRAYADLGWCAASTR